MRTGATAAFASLAGYTLGLAMIGGPEDQWFTGLISTVVAFGLGYCTEGEGK